MTINHEHMIAQHHLLITCVECDVTARAVAAAANVHIRQLGFQATCLQDERQRRDRFSEPLPHKQGRLVM